MLTAEEETRYLYQERKKIVAERKEAELGKEEAEKYQRLKEEYVCSLILIQNLYIQLYSTIRNYVFKFLHNYQQKFFFCFRWKNK